MTLLHAQVVCLHQLFWIKLSDFLAKFLNKTKDQLWPLIVAQQVSNSFLMEMWKKSTVCVCVRGGGNQVCLNINPIPHGLWEIRYHTGGSTINTHWYLAYKTRLICHPDGKTWYKMNILVLSCPQIPNKASFPEYF